MKCKINEKIKRVEENQEIIMQQCYLSLNQNIHNQIKVTNLQQQKRGKNGNPKEEKIEN